MKKFDKEYSTSWVEEMKWLKNNGIQYSFVKVVDGITVYKYEKTPKLFIALALYFMIKMEE